MQFWAACVVCLWLGIALFNWVTGLHWLAKFSLPMSVIAGLGLAIASTASSAIAAPSKSINSPADSPSSIDSEPPVTETASNPPQSPRPKSNQPTESSISFTINKNV